MVIRSGSWSSLAHRGEDGGFLASFPFARRMSQGDIDDIDPSRGKHPRIPITPTRDPISRVRERTPISTVDQATEADFRYFCVLPLGRAGIARIAIVAPNRSWVGPSLFGQARDHADVDGVALRDLGQRLTGGPAPDRLGALVVRQLPLASELHAFGHGPLAAIPGALADQIALELGDGSQQGRHQLALRRSGVE